jgi:thiamine-phosphate pyrophosphorylase
MLSPQASYQQKMTFFTEQVTLYPVSCEPLANGRTDIDWLEGVLAGGAKIVQLRDKVSDDRIFFEKAQKLTGCTWATMTCHVKKCGKWRRT